MDFKISTMTVCSMFLNEQIDLFNVSKYMPLGNGIVGIKHNIGGKCVVKGAYSKKESKSNFYNQISILIETGPNNEINCKLFANGTIQMTGCKSKEDAQNAMRILYKTLLGMALETREIMLFKDMNEVLVDTDNFVYSMTSKRVIGFKKGDDSYTIKSKVYKIDGKTGLFIDTKKIKNKFTILDYDGNEIGHKSIEISKGIKRLYKKNTRTTTIGDMIYFCNENSAIVLGQNVYSLNDEQLVTLKKCNEEMSDILLVQYTCSPFMEGSILRDMQYIPEFNVEIHCANATFDLKQTIDRQVLYEELLKRDYLCKFNPQIYAGVKLLFKMPLKNEKTNGLYDGLCKCNNKCTCSKVTFLIFHSGKVIATGIKNESETRDLIKSFANIVSKINT